MSGHPEGTDLTGLVADCTTLLGLKDELRGTGTLDWSVDTTMHSWTGLTYQGSIAGTPPRVTNLLARLLSLDGTIPAALGTRDKLEQLWLDNNQLDGSILAITPVCVIGTRPGNSQPLGRVRQQEEA